MGEFCASTGPAASTTLLRDRTNGPSACLQSLEPIDQILFVISASANTLKTIRRHYASDFSVKKSLTIIDRHLLKLTDPVAVRFY